MGAGQRVVIKNVHDELSQPYILPGMQTGVDLSRSRSGVLFAVGETGVGRVDPPPPVNRHIA